MQAIFARFILPILVVLGIVAAVPDTPETPQEPEPSVVEHSEDDHAHDEFDNHTEEDAELEQEESVVEDVELEESEPTTTELAYGSAAITTDDTYRYISSDGLPNHETGTFPNSGNPNAISAQDHDYRVVLSPVHTGRASNASLPGVALNGIPLEPGTGEFYDRDPSSGWKEEAFYQGEGRLGIDWSNAHVQPDGTYHYHALPEGLLQSARADQSGDLIQLAWAADGFPIYYSQSNAYSSSWRLKSGTRPNDPGGTYDGLYEQDFEYVAGLGDLDECNGTTLAGGYGYIITEDFPRLPRCLFGTIDDSFARGPGGGTPPSGGQGGVPQDGGPTGNAGAPPQEAIDACNGASQGSSCSVSTPNGTLSGTCQTPPGQSVMACVPSNR